MFQDTVLLRLLLETNIAEGKGNVPTVNTHWSIFLKEEISDWSKNLDHHVTNDIDDYDVTE